MHLPITSNMLSPLLHAVTWNLNMSVVLYSCCIPHSKYILLNIIYDYVKDYFTISLNPLPCLLYFQAPAGMYANYFSHVFCFSLLCLIILMIMLL